MPGAAAAGFPQVTLRKTGNSVRLEQPIQAQPSPPAVASPAGVAANRVRFDTSPAVKSPPVAGMDADKRASRVRSMQAKSTVPPPPAAADDDDGPKLAP